MRLLKLGASALLACLAGLGLVWVAGTLVARPVNRAVPAFDAPARPVRLVAGDGVPIAGTYWPAAREGGPAILLLHGVNNDRNIFRRQARWLNGLGYAVLAIDFRGHGASGAAERSFGWREAEDAAAALAFLRSGAPRRKVGVVGVSQGGAAALLREEGPLPVEAMVLQAVYPDIRTAILNRLERSGSSVLASLGEPLLSYQAYLRYGVAPERIAPLHGIRQYRGPVLVIGGVDDRDTTVADTRALHGAAAGPKELWLVESADHVETSKLWTPEYKWRVRAFFAAHLGEPGSGSAVR